MAKNSVFQINVVLQPGLKKGKKYFSEKDSIHNVAKKWINKIAHWGS